MTQQLKLAVGLFCEFHYIKKSLHNVRIFLVAGAGLEPTTFGLWAQRATNCSIPRYLLCIYIKAIIKVSQIQDCLDIFSI